MAEKRTRRKLLFDTAIAGGGFLLNRLIGPSGTAVPAAPEPAVMPAASPAAPISDRPSIGTALPKAASATGEVLARQVIPNWKIEPMPTALPDTLGKLPTEAQDIALPSHRNVVLGFTKEETIALGREAQMRVSRLEGPFDNGPTYSHFVRDNPEFRKDIGKKVHYCFRRLPEDYTDFPGEDPGPYEAKFIEAEKRVKETLELYGYYTGIEVEKVPPRAANLEVRLDLGIGEGVSYVFERSGVGIGTKYVGQDLTSPNIFNHTGIHELIAHQFLGLIHMEDKCIVYPDEMGGFGVEADPTYDLFKRIGMASNYAEHLDKDNPRPLIKTKFFDVSSAAYGEPQDLMGVYDSPKKFGPLELAILAETYPGSPLNSRLPENDSLLQNAFGQKDYKIIPSSEVEIDGQKHKVVTLRLTGEGLFGYDAAFMQIGDHHAALSTLKDSAIFPNLLDQPSNIDGIRIEFARGDKVISSATMLGPVNIHTLREAYAQADKGLSLRPKALSPKITLRQQTHVTSPLTVTTLAELDKRHAARSALEPFKGSLIQVGDHQLSAEGLTDYLANPTNRPVLQLTDDSRSWLFNGAADKRYIIQGRLGFNGNATLPDDGSPHTTLVMPSDTNIILESGHVDRIENIQSVRVSTGLNVQEVDQCETIFLDAQSHVGSYIPPITKRNRSVVQSEDSATMDRVCLIEHYPNTSIQKTDVNKLLFSPATLAQIDKNDIQVRYNLHNGNNLDATQLEDTDIRNIMSISVSLKGNNLLSIFPDSRNPQLGLDLGIKQLGLLNDTDPTGPEKSSLKLESIRNLPTLLGRLVELAQQTQRTR